MSGLVSFFQPVRRPVAPATGKARVTDPLHPTPYTLHPTPCILHPTPYTLHPGHRVDADGRCEVSGLVSFSQPVRRPVAPATGKARVTDLGFENCHLYY